MGIPKFPALRGWHSSPDDGRISKKELEEVLSSQEARNEIIFSGFSVATAYDGGSADLKHIKNDGHFRRKSGDINDFHVKTCHVGKLWIDVVDEPSIFWDFEEVNMNFEQAVYGDLENMVI